MKKYSVVKTQTLVDIADAIRRKTGKTDKIPPEQMESEIDSIVTADNALVLKDNERIYQVGNAESIANMNNLFIVNATKKS